jgi:hypothetical protein
MRAHAGARNTDGTVSGSYGTRRLNGEEREEAGWMIDGISAANRQRWRGIVQRRDESRPVEDWQMSHAAPLLPRDRGWGRRRDRQSGIAAGTIGAGTWGVVVGQSGVVGLRCSRRGGHGGVSSGRQIITAAGASRAGREHGRCEEGSPQQPANPIVAPRQPHQTVVPFGEGITFLG